MTRRNPNTSAHERLAFLRELREAEKSTLGQRQEACRDLLNALRDPTIIAERVHWLLIGNYGRGAYDEAWRVLQNRRMNRVAWMVVTIAALDWQCPKRLAVAAWRRLSAEEKRRLHAVVDREISEARPVV